MMQPTRADDGVRTATGILLEVDVPGRELKVFADGASQAFDVATDCPVYLHGERVRLRLLQPGDYAQVCYTHEAGAAVARSIRVNWWFPGPTEARATHPVPAHR
jgi:hypothetical protein